MKQYHEKIKDYMVIILILAIIFLLGYVYGNIHSWTGIRQWFGKAETKYEFISPLLSCPESKYIQDSRNVNLERPLIKFVEENKLNSGINHVSIYFRDLNNGYRFGLNEKESFTPASLTKVPTLIAVLKRSESEPSFIYQSTKYTLPEVDYNTHYPPKDQIKSNQIYSIKELLSYMIKYSDNSATQILRDLLGKNRFSKTYTTLGISMGEFNNIQVLEYASFFRILFNASYLSKEDSEFALNLLSQVEFKQGLVSGVPENIKIAHKFGEYSLDGDVKQIHDCGIIYYPSHPYLLCIMTRGDNYTELENVLSKTSKLVFGEVNNVYKEIK